MKLEKSPIKPLADRIIAQKIKGEEKTTAAGLKIIQDDKETPYKAVILEVGPGRQPEGMPLQRGEIILVAPGKGYDMKINEIELIIIRLGDVVAIAPKEF
jgi:co-chaperonin GroES (HSP10)